jgi:hypothetical protein
MLSLCWIKSDPFTWHCERRVPKPRFPITIGYVDSLPRHEAERFRGVHFGSDANQMVRSEQMFDCPEKAKRWVETLEALNDGT